MCDGTEDCPDQSDELDCPASDTISQDQGINSTKWKRRKWDFFKAQELHVLKDVGESFEESAQTKIDEEKKKTGVQVTRIFKLSENFRNHTLFFLFF